MKSVNTILHKAAKKVYDPEEIDDIVVFGSYMKGKEDYKDIDIVLIFKDKVNKKREDAFRKEIKLQKIDVHSVTLEELENENFIAKEGLYLEGKSLITERLLSERLGFASMAFVKYDISDIKGSKRIKLYYAMQGRGDSKGFFSQIGAKRYSDNVIICDYAVIEKLKPFFEYWNIECQITPALIPKRLRQILLS